MTGTYKHEFWFRCPNHHRTVIHTDQMNPTNPLCDRCNQPTEVWKSTVSPEEYNKAKEKK